MLEYHTADVFKSFVLGAAAVIGGGLLFESGKRYVKTAGSNLFKGKIEALPFFFAVVIFGYFLQGFEPVAEDIVHSIPPLTRLGVMVFGTMVLFNNSVDYFTYSDPKSVIVYAIGLALIFLPYL